MKTQTAIKLAGGSAVKLASILNIHPSAISHWGDDVPRARYFELMAIKPSWFRGKNADNARSTN